MQAVPRGGPSLPPSPLLPPARRLPGPCLPLRITFRLWKYVSSPLRSSRSGNGCNGAAAFVSWVSLMIPIFTSTSPDVGTGTGTSSTTSLAFAGDSPAGEGLISGSCAVETMQLK